MGGESLLLPAGARVQSLLFPALMMITAILCAWRKRRDDGVGKILASNGLLNRYILVKSPQILQIIPSHKRIGRQRQNMFQLRISRFPMLTFTCSSNARGISMVSAIA